MTITEEMKYTCPECGRIGMSFTATNRARCYPCGFRCSRTWLEESALGETYPVIRRPKSPEWKVGDGFVVHGVPWTISHICNPNGPLSGQCHMINLDTMKVDSEAEFPPALDREFKTKTELLNLAATRAEESE